MHDANPKLQKITDDLHRALFAYYKGLSKGPKICMRAYAHIPGAGHPLNRTAIFGTSVIVAGRRIIPSDKAKLKSPHSSMVQVEIRGTVCTGEVIAVFQHQQPQGPRLELAHIRLMKHAPLPLNVWAD